MASSTIILNSTHNVAPNKYSYVFPTSVAFSSSDKIGLQSISLYNSFFQYYKPALK